MQPVASSYWGLTAFAVDGRPAELTVLVDTGAGRTGFRPLQLSPADGVLGFDVLSRFRLFVNHKRRLLVAEPFNGFWDKAKFLWKVAKAM